MNIELTCFSNISCKIKEGSVFYTSSESSFISYALYDDANYREMMKDYNIYLIKNFGLISNNYISENVDISFKIDKN